MQTNKTKTKHLDTALFANKQRENPKIGEINNVVMKSKYWFPLSDDIDNLGRKGSFWYTGNNRLF